MLERLTGPDQVARVVGAAEQTPMEASVRVRSTPVAIRINTKAEGK